MTRRFQAGDSFFVSGLHLRVVAGEKLQRGTDEVGHDLRLECRGVNGSWETFDITLVAVVADFMFENEEHLYPPRFGFKGGAKFREFLSWAMRHGWDKAVAGLRAEAPQPSLFEKEPVS